MLYCGGYRRVCLIMKPESLKHLQNLYERTEDKYFKETIEAIFRLESETKSKKGKFNIWDYVSNDDIRKYTYCVFHDNGYKVATDSFIMVALKEDYPEDMEGKLMRKDGTIEDENVKFPNWRKVIPDPQKMEMMAVTLDFAGIRAFEADFKAKKKLNKKMKGYVRVGGCLFKLDYLIKAVRFMEHVGTDELILLADNRKVALAVSGDSKMILMPVFPRTEFKDNEVCYEA